MQKQTKAETNTENFKFKVFKVYKKSSRRKVIARNLTEVEAQKLVRSFPDSNTSMVCYTRQ